MLVVGTYRSDELYPRVPMREWRARLLTQRLAEEVRLPRLSRGRDRGHDRRAARPRCRAAVADAVHDRSDGIPLHVEESAGDAAGTPAGGSGLPVPDTLADAVLARAERARPGRPAAWPTPASVIGRSFDFDLLAAVSERDPADVDDGLRRLPALYLVQPGADPAASTSATP